MAKSFSLPLTCLLACSSLAVLKQNSFAADWTVRTPRLIGPQLNAIASSPSRAVAVGREGQIVTSPDGASWSPQNVGTNRNLQDVIYSGGRFVAVGALYNSSGVHSLALTSTDGLAWTERPTDSRAWKSITHGNGLFVAVGDHTIDTSPDGITWTRRVPQCYVQFQGVAHGNGTFVATGVWTDGLGSYFYSVQRSIDGVNWTGITAPTNRPLHGIAFGGGQFVMVGDAGLIYTSGNGLDWTLRNTLATGGGVLNDIAFVNGSFFAVGDSGLIIRSSDGVTWFSAEDSESSDLFGCGAAFGRVIAVGERSSILSSADQRVWTSPVAGTYSDLRAITFALQKYVAVGTHGSGVVSTNGQQWTPRPVYQTPGGMPSTSFNAITFGSGSFVTVGGQGFPVFASSDGLSWSGQHLNLGVDEFFGLSHANGRFIAVGVMSTGYGVQGGIRTSDNRTTWSTRLAGLQQPLRSITCGGNGLWVAAGDDIVTSLDGISWTSRTVPVEGTLYAATFGRGRFVLAGEVGGVVSSPDGINWSFNSAFGSGQVRGLAFGGTDFVAVGERGGRGVVWSSPDGLGWTESGSAPYPLNAVIYTNGLFTAVGDHGLVVQSSPASGRLAVQRMANGSVEVSCRAEVGRQYRLQSSVDGRTWQNLMTFTATTSDQPYRDTNPSARVRLYRLVSP